MKSFVVIVSTAALLGTTQGASADALLLDFGSTLYTGTDSPGHQDGSATGSQWNNVSGDKSSGFVDENNTPVAGIGVDFGTGVLASINYGNATKPLTVDHSAYPHWNDALGQDHVVRDSGDPAVAVAITGLAEGTYDFYLTGFRGDGVTNSNRDYDVRWTTSTTAVTDFTAATQDVLENSNPSSVNTWIAGDNYITGQFTVTGAGEDLYLYSNSSGFIGVMNSLEIVPTVAAIPEPASLMLLAAGSLALCGRRRRTH